MQIENLDHFGALLAETARAWRTRLDQRLKPLGLSQAKWIVLLHLSKADGAITQKELAQRVGIEGPTLVGLLDRLSADGLVERRESATDRRSKTVHLTARAGQITRRITDVARALRSELLNDIDAEQIRCCQQTLEQIKQHLDQL